MTLDEAILHAYEKSQGCGECAAEHAQLAEWLIELRELKVGGEYKRGYEDGLRANTKAAFAAAKQAADYWKRMYEETFAERTCRIEGRYGNQYCTCCGEMVGTWDSTSELYIDGNMVELWNYCPNCGARVEVN